VVSPKAYLECGRPLFIWVFREENFIRFCVDLLIRISDVFKMVNDPPVLMNYDETVQLIQVCENVKHLVKQDVPESYTVAALSKLGFVISKELCELSSYRELPKNPITIFVGYASIFLIVEWMTKTVHILKEIG
jgi:hypothetical protein